ncbi:GntR family transcriptional regulator [Shigella sonnei]
MARGHIPSPLPSQSALAEMYNISRTTVRHILSHLRECGVLTQVGNDYVIARKPDHDDGFACTTASISQPLTRMRRLDAGWKRLCYCA